MQKTANRIGGASLTDEVLPGHQVGILRLLTKTLIIMKLTAFFMLLWLLQVQARGVSQNITFSARNAPIEKILSVVKNQTGYVIFGNEAFLKKMNKVTIRVSNMPLADFLDTVFSGQGVNYEITSKTIVITEWPKQRQNSTVTGPDIGRSDLLILRVIHGRITDAAGTPLAGASIQVKGKKKLIVSDENGRFSIDVEIGDELEVSFIGYKTSAHRISSHNDMLHISLQRNVDEEQEIVISTGFQRISRERAAGAYDVIDRTMLSKRPVSDISTALQGLIPGMQAIERLDGTAEFEIRGRGTLGANYQPLIVVDGFPITGSNFSTINPNDVESVTVLKDAAAASIWGARSGNGVIVVTTKHARNKVTSGKVNIEVNAFTKISDRIDLNQVMNQAGAADMINYERIAYDRGLHFPPAYGGTFQEINKPLTLAGELILANRAGLIPAGQMNKSLDSLSSIDNRGQFQDLLMRRGLVNQVNISVFTGTAKSKNYASILFENRKEGFRFRGYDRVILNYNNQYQPASFIDFGLGTNIEFRKTDRTGAEVLELQGLSPYETLLNPDGSYSVNLNTWNREQLAQLPLQNFPYQDWSYNLLREVRGRKIKDERLSARFQATMNLMLAKGLTWENKFQLERNILEGESYYNDETFIARNMVNNMVEYNSTTQLVSRKLLPVGGILQSSKRTIQGYVFRSQVGYNLESGNRHSVNAIAGTEITKSKEYGGQNPLLYGYYPEKNQSTVPPYGYGSSVDVFRNFLNQTQSIDGGAPMPVWLLDKFVSFYGNASYTYNNKYTVTASARSDASNYITDDPSLRWAPMWSIGGLWHIYREEFMKHNHFVERLSIRLTHGRNGNADKTSSNKPIVNIGTSPSANTGTIIGTISDFGNPYLRWEKTVTTNLGIDFALLGNKLNGKIDLYNKKGVDIMGLVQLPSATGVTSQRFNNAQINNKGIELQLGATIGSEKGISYNPILTYAYNRNLVTRLNVPNLTVANLINGTDVEGRPIGAIYSYTYLGMIDSIPHFAGIKGAATSFNTSTIASVQGKDVLNYEGTTIPPHTLGFINNLRYRNLSLMIVTVGKFGGVFRRPAFSFSNQTGVGALKTNITNLVGEMLAGDPAIPGLPKYGEPNFYVWDRYTPFMNTLIRSSSYLELKEVNLQYRLSGVLSRKLRMTDASVFAQVRDLGLLWENNEKGYHPDWLPGSNRPVTSYTIGLNVKL